MKLRDFIKKDVIVTLDSWEHYLPHGSFVVSEGIGATGDRLLVISPISGDIPEISFSDKTWISEDAEKVEIEIL